jgi:hypothetical protein
MAELRQGLGQKPIQSQFLPRLQDNVLDFDTAWAGGGAASTREALVEAPGVVIGQGELVLKHPLDQPQLPAGGSPLLSRLLIVGTRGLTEATFVAAVEGFLKRRRLVDHGKGSPWRAVYDG